MDAKSHWLHLFDFSPLCIFKCFLKSPASEDAYSHWLHLLDFSPLCVFKCVLKLPAQKDIKLHWLHLFDFSPLCLFKCVLKLPAQKEAKLHWLHLLEFFFISCAFQRDTYIAHTSIKVMIIKILIHHHQSGIVGPSLLSV